MPAGRHAARHSGQSDYQRRPPRYREPFNPRRRKATIYGTVAIAAVFSLLVATAAVRAIDRSSTASLSALSCTTATRLEANSATFTTPLGVNASGSSQLASATAEFGHLPVIRVYYAGVPYPNEWPTDWSTADHSAMVVSFNPTPAAVLSGSDDAALARYFDAAPRGNSIYYSFYPEPEAHIKDGEFSFAQYKAAWARIVSIANAAHNPDLHSTLILQGQDARPHDEYNFSNYLPSGGVISALGWDAYPDGTVEDADIQVSPPAAFMGDDVAAARSVGLPFGFAEFALGTASGRPQWLTQVADYLQSEGALFGTLFNATGFPWMMLDDSASIQTWRAAVAHSADGAPAPAPAPSSPAPAPTPSTPTPTPSKPAPVPSRSTLPGPPPATPALTITGLSVAPRTLVVTGSSHVRIRFKLNQAARVSICLLNSQGDVVRQLNRPNLPAGWTSIRYYGYGQQHRPLPAGCYQAMVVASNDSGSTSAQLGLAVIGIGATAGHYPARSTLSTRAVCARQPGGPI